MLLKQNISDIYVEFTSNETLLRLLYYKPVNASDNPLDSNKPNILDMDEQTRDDIIQQRIIFTPTYDGLDGTDPICRICIYPGRRRPNSSYLISDQYINVDIFTHQAFNDVDLRLTWLCDTVNGLMFGQRVTGLGKVQFVGGRPLDAPVNFTAYQLTYDIGSFNK